MGAADDELKDAFQSPFGVGAIARPIAPDDRTPPGLMFQSPFGVGAIARAALTTMGSPCGWTSFNPLSGWGRLQAHSPSFIPSGLFPFQSPFGVGAIARQLTGKTKYGTPIRRSRFNPLSGWGRLQGLQVLRDRVDVPVPSFNPLSGWGRLQGKPRHRSSPRSTTFQSPFGVGAIASQTDEPRGPRNRPQMTFQSPFGVGAIASCPAEQAGLCMRGVSFNPLSGWGRLQGSTRMSLDSCALTSWRFNPLSGWGRLQGRTRATVSGIIPPGCGPVKAQNRRNRGRSRRHRVWPDLGRVRVRTPFSGPFEPGPPGTLSHKRRLSR